MLTKLLKDDRIATVSSKTPTNGIEPPVCSGGALTESGDASVDGIEGAVRVLDHQPKELLIGVGVVASAT